MQQENEKPEAPEESAARKSVQGTFSVVASLFAVLGALAAVAQIYEFFGRSQASLKEEVRMSKSFIPEQSKISLTAGESAIWQVGNPTIIAHYCDVTVDHTRNYFFDQENCKEIKSVISKVNTSSHFGEKEIERLEVSLQNTGSESAKNIRVRLGGDGSLVGTDQANQPVVSVTAKAGEAISLPDMNPGDSYKLIVDTEKSAAADVYPEKLIPTISYDRGAASVTLYQIVPPIYGKLANLLDGIPAIFIIVGFIIGSFIITFAFILAIVIVEAILKGKPLSSIFSQPSTSSD